MNFINRVLSSGLGALLTTALCLVAVSCSSGGSSGSSGDDSFSEPGKVTVTPQYDASVERGLVYASESGAAQATKDLTLDVYQPDGPGLPERSPALILIHGGGFVVGSRMGPEIEEIAVGFAERGYVVFSIDYHLVSDDPPLPDSMLPVAAFWTSYTGTVVENTILAAIEDTLKATDWVIANADVYGVDVERIGLIGASAGAVTALHVAYLIGDLGVAKPDYAVVVSLWGWLWIADGDPRVVDDFEAPIFMVHGEIDDTVPVELPELLAAHAARVGLAHELHVVAGAGHGFDEIDLQMDEAEPGVTLFDAMVSFVHEHACTKSYCL